jgi:lipoprotein-releasing system permease protein
MNLSYYFAKRYLFAKKSTQAINIISIISVIGICIGSAALFVILSVFNGFEELNLVYYKKLNPDLKITRVDAQMFNEHELDKNISNIPQNLLCIKSLEQYALLRYLDNPFYARVKGVDSNFLNIPMLDSTLVAGGYYFDDEGIDYMVLGYGLTQRLGIELNQTLEQISVFAVKPKARFNTLDPMTSLNRKEFFPSAVFSVQQEMDEEQTFISLTQAQKLYDLPNKINAIELYLNDESDISKVQSIIQKNLPAEYEVKNRYQLNEMLYKVLNSERWAVYLIMTFILSVAICNIIGAITMLIIDKKKDIQVLSGMGMSAKSIRRIFLIQAMMISVIGVLIGLAIGSVFVVLQENYGIIKISGSEEFLIQAYPIKMMWRDYVWVLATVLILSFITAWATSKQSNQIVGK